jgi:hypothetical protein
LFRRWQRDRNLKVVLPYSKMWQLCFLLLMLWFWYRQFLFCFILSRIRYQLFIFEEITDLNFYISFCHLSLSFVKYLPATCSWLQMKQQCFLNALRVETATKKMPSFRQIFFLITFYLQSVLLHSANCVKPLN